MLATIVDLDALGKVVVAALVAGVGITAVFGLVIYGGTRFMDLRREGRSLGAGAFAGLAAISSAVFLAGLVYGISIMASK
jgi:hypothetical protein